ncbi:30S ribosomal protein S20 [Candidatus Persebacteraceae bacterium Df01]|jgi:small subunit ribosomal protein S20|uniref:Small ribosomal subunit protein bS20 n=1 Tax=Candidatus Doriopsillibacter californiensis TaxID=2970740 RepID=A0ABT7QLA1_9GAMM|nr:30S ribosomal protein S20 [Candidatus Persebacteraceae bacterium Df01]
MANTKQSEKRARQALTRHKRGQAIRSRYRTAVKKVRACAGNAEEGRAAFHVMQSIADKAARKEMLHPNTVARVKRRLNRLIQTTAVKGKVDKEAA